MYLKKLEIQGFKSFADKLTFEFNNGITAVVGPNGSGKSNVADAVRWVLGEQSIKTLRGSKMEDVIFAGTQNRKPLGFAQVSLVIDNSANLLPIEFEEVTVTRRVYRSGESEYFINRSSCRLRDIHELFMDTGIGKEGYSIIGQGQIDKILSTKPDDRRQLFEEAVGIVKYKTRKQQAEKKLEEEKNNLLRVTDILYEIEKQLLPLKEQAQKAKKYLDKREQLKTIEANIFLKEALTISKQNEKLLMDLQTVENQIEQLSQNQSILKKNQADQIKDTEILEKKLHFCREEIKKIQSLLEENILQEKIQEQKKEYLYQEIKRLDREEKQINSKLMSKNNEQKQYKSQYQGLQLQFKSKEEILKINEKKQKQMLATMSSNAEQVEQLKADMIENLNQRSEIKSKIERLETIYEHIQQRHEYVDKTKKSLLYQIHLKNTQKDTFENKLDSLRATIQELTITKSSLEHEKKNELSQLQQYQNQYHRLQEEFHKLQSRQKLLEEMTKDYEGFYRSVKSILSLKKQKPNEWCDIHGVVADLIHVPKGYEIAYEIALGSNVQNIITETENIAQIAIEYLKKHQLGRATFLPLNSINGRKIGSEKSKILQYQGVLGIASDLITYNPIYDSIMTYLLGRIIIVENLQYGIILAKKLRYRYRIVTLEGEVLNPGGSLTGGSISNKNTNVFSRARQLKDTTERVILLEKQVQQTHQKISDIEVRLKEKDNILEELIQQQQENMVEKIELSGQIDHIQNQIETLKEEKNNILNEELQLKEQSQEAQEMIHKEQKRQAENEQCLQDIETKIQQQESTLQIDRSSQEKLAKVINQLHIDISILCENQKNIMNYLERLKAELKQLKDEKEQCLQNKENKIKEKQSKEHFIQELLNKRIKIQTQLKDEEKKEQEWEIQKKDIESQRQKLQKLIEEQVEEHTVLQKELFHLEHHISKLEIQKTTLYDRMWNEYELTYSSAQKYKKENISLSSLKEKAQALKQFIKSLGPVNVHAVEEFTTLQERYNFLIKQKQDIIDAEKSLDQIIDNLTKAMEEQFAQEFKKISFYFNQVFKELFGGGTAYVELIDSNNILESGIQIIAQPPGKKLQNMMLLSGGERALTAIALLFAILKIRPSPFCILDEIEAALDDSNVDRYARYLKEFTNDTQFIVITHRKGTMEVADTLYGITMQEQGVSTLVSVKLTEATN
ncbi:MAG: chromosome segregation protein SMC [Epulopiscium sp.]|nr:chromosome segregation protein SMC [Candidatus Epulonipiscium sp.]